MSAWSHPRWTPEPGARSQQSGTVGKLHDPAWWLCNYWHDLPPWPWCSPVKYLVLTWRTATRSISLRPYARAKESGADLRVHLSAVASAFLDLYSMYRFEERFIHLIAGFGRIACLANESPRTKSRTGNICSARSEILLRMERFNCGPRNGAICPPVIFYSARNSAASNRGESVELSEIQINRTNNSGIDRELRNGYRDSLRSSNRFHEQSAASFAALPRSAKRSIVAREGKLPRDSTRSWKRFVPFFLVYL